MRPYKLKHIPTGLYYQPIKQYGSHFSKKGKIYQTKANILTMTFTSDDKPRKQIWIEAHPSTIVYKETKDILEWKEIRHNRNLVTITFSDEWEIEEIIYESKNK